MSLEEPEFDKIDLKGMGAAEIEKLYNKCLQQAISVMEESTEERGYKTISDGWRRRLHEISFLGLADKDKFREIAPQMSDAYISGLIAAAQLGMLVMGMKYEQKREAENN